MKKWIALIVSIVALVGCGGQNAPTHQKTKIEEEVSKQSTATLTINATASTDEEKQQINKAGEALNAACPLLGIYANDIASATATIEKTDRNMMDGEYHTRGWKNYVEFDVVVKNPVSIIPQAYYAAGHHCTFRVGSDNAVHTAKQPCAKICKGSGVDAPGMIWFWIKK